MLHCGTCLRQTNLQQKGRFHDQYDGSLGFLRCGYLTKSMGKVLIYGDYVFILYATTVWFCPPFDAPNDYAYPIQSVSTPTHVGMKHFRHKQQSK